MINPYDLMLGNWVLLKGVALPVQVIVMAPRMGETVTPSSEKNVTIHMLINGERCENLDAIPLSPEWLEKLGFKVRIETENGTSYKGPEFFDVAIWKKNTPSFKKGEITAIYFSLETPVKYVHELQNLYRIHVKKTL